MMLCSFGNTGFVVARRVIIHFGCSYATQGNAQKDVADVNAYMSFSFANSKNFQTKTLVV